MNDGLSLQLNKIEASVLADHLQHLDDPRLSEIGVRLSDQLASVEYLWALFVEARDAYLASGDS